MSNIINKKAYRTAVLQEAKETRHHKFTQLEGAAYHAAEVHIREYIKNLVARQPSKGKTIRAI